MIRIEGLSQKDVEICNLLWNCESVEDVERMVNAMPAEYKRRAQSLRELMTAGMLDTVEEVSPNVTSYLQRIASL